MAHTHGILIKTLGFLLVEKNGMFLHVTGICILSNFQDDNLQYYVSRWFCNEPLDKLSKCFLIESFSWNVVSITFHSSKEIQVKAKQTFAPWKYRAKTTHKMESKKLQPSFETKSSFFPGKNEWCQFHSRKFSSGWSREKDWSVHHTKSAPWFLPSCIDFWPDSGFVT